MFPRLLEVLRVGSVIALGAMAVALTSYRLLAPRDLSELDDDFQGSQRTRVVHASSAQAARRPPCRGWPLLVGHDAAGVPRRAYVRATRGKREIAMELDTGSASSFVPFDLGADPAVERLEERVVIGDSVRQLPGRRVSIDPDTYGARERGGLAVDGVLGAEEVLTGVTDLDLRDGCLTVHPSPFVLPETKSWLEVPFRVVNGVIVTTVEVDGDPHGVLFDTGVGYSILISDVIHPYAAHQVVHDVRGERVDLYDRYGFVRWGSGPREEVWVERTPSFRTFDDMRLGDVRAMVGISAMGARRIVIDNDRSLLLVEPREE